MEMLVTETMNPDNIEIKSINWEQQCLKCIT